jgi:hypothetical protein
MVKSENIGIDLNGKIVADGTSPGATAESRRKITVQKIQSK